MNNYQDSTSRSPTVELILSEIKNIKDDLIEHKKCVVCVKGTEVVYRIDDLDKQIENEKVEREKVDNDLYKKHDRLTQLIIATLVAGIMNLIGIIAIFLSQNAKP